MQFAQFKNTTPKINEQKYGKPKNAPTKKNNKRGNNS